MKKLLLLVCALFVFQIASAQKNTIYVVRHAEKDASDKNARNPELSLEGKQRALDLKDELKSKNIDVIFTTDFTRTRNTAGPLKDYKGIPSLVYNPSNLEDLVKLVKTDYAGKNVLIVGHSNTILETVAAFGGEKIVDSVSDDTYDHLFKIVINGSKISTTGSRYGVKSEVKN